MTASSIMLDLETLGTKPGCIVLTLGAVRFDPETGEIKSRFYRKINFKQSVLLGLKCDPTTYAWWQRQAEEVRKEAFGGTDDPKDVAVSFAKWAHEGGAPSHWWSQGMDFDYPILEAMYRATNGQVPWKFWEKRDTRTAYAVASFEPKSVVRDGSHHNALDDCIHQVACLHAAFTKLGIAKPPVVPDDLEEDIEL
ncbi:uncharacterized protein DUF5051 [Gemmobacter caeni]|uniref:Uncharacterized protein DUF5051 n=1 Tax=Gemmobacter caeni TaxID=589035 RepID=A0A2T6AZ48_9RHOB|nr:3'-5' exonuclease [Gemmobacter caeni]PTX49085.1 uncharacterized protein DUF5051 [Gemmobacter caeni]TWI98914.1 uncharacterized protein DUF5051 [Gemmobacter caeni]